MNTDTMTLVSGIYEAIDAFYAHDAKAFLGQASSLWSAKFVSESSIPLKPRNKELAFT